jgi:hypothetical protein
VLIICNTEVLIIVISSFQVRRRDLSAVNEEGRSGSNLSSIREAGFGSAKLRLEICRFFFQEVKGGC